MERNTATYNETLKCVETFLKKTCIKSFCVEICMGACCSGCYEKSKDACHRQEGIRLACSCFLCSSLINPLTTIERNINKNNSPSIDKMCGCFRHIISIINQLNEFNTNVYFSPTMKHNQKAFRIDRAVLKDLRSVTKNIGNLMVEYMANPKYYYAIESMVRNRDARRERNRRNEARRSKRK